MARLFFALWPAAIAANAFESLGRELSGRCGGNAVPASKVHLTLAFLGEIAADRLDEATAAGAHSRFAPFELAFDTAGWFRGARVAWAGCSHPPAPLLELQRRLDGRLRGAGFALDSRPYVPHITLVRKARSAIASGGIAPIGWRATALSLVRSETGTGRYATIASWEMEQPTSG